MERFRPLRSQSNNFVDPLTASLSTDDDAVSVGEDPINPLLSGYSSDNNKPNIRQQDDYFSNSRPQPVMTPPRVLGAGLPYCSEWSEICQCASSPLIQSLGRSGEMRACRFRSVCWFVYLHILPTDHTQWLQVIRGERERYETLRLEMMVTPGLGNEALDPLLNNPLSQDEQSPWNQYFEDSELKKLIRQDVVRTFPEVEFFQSQTIRDLMVVVLFCHARCKPELGYRQGMHEILAPLIFVLHCDHQAHKHAREMDDAARNMLQEVMDESYLEHDAFSLFEGVMKGLEPWYIVGQQADPDPRSSLVNAQPFARPQDVGPTNQLVQKLTSIHDVLLQRYDPPLYSHLDRLEIPPQLYGIRWIRLLFGREFALQDLLMIWDAIFSDFQPDTFPLVDFLTVAMLSFIREPLLSGDYTTCLKFLMRYPASADVQYIIQLALHLRNPKQYPRPPGYSSLATHHIPTVGGRPEVHRGPQPPQQQPHTTALPTAQRSSSVPRTGPHPPHTVATRVTQQQQQQINNAAARRLSSPSAVTDPLNAAVIFSINSTPSVPNDTGPNTATTTNTNSYPGRASRVVSGLVRLGGKLGRPKELPVTSAASSQGFAQSPPMNSTNAGAGPISIGGEPTMKELTIVRTQSVPAGGVRPKVERRVPRQHPPHHHDSQHSQSDASVADITAVCIGCAVTLSHHTAGLRTRLEQLSVQPDVTIRTALDGIAEVIETLANLQSRDRASCNSSLSNGQAEEEEEEDETPEGGGGGGGSTSGPSSLVPALTYEHPLSDATASDTHLS